MNDYMYEAERVDNGEIIIGYYVKITNGSKTKHLIYTGRAEIEIDDEFFPDWYEINPETLCTIILAVKPIKVDKKLYACPNCSCVYNPFGQAYEYCPHCGTALSWEGIPNG